MSIDPTLSSRLSALRENQTQSGGAIPQMPPQETPPNPQQLSAEEFMKLAKNNDDQEQLVNRLRAQRNEYKSEAEKLKESQGAENPNQGAFGKLVNWGTKNPKDARQAFIIGFIVVLSLVLLGYFMFGSSESCGTANKQNIQEIDAKIGHDGYMIAFILHLKSSPTSTRNLVAIARDADLSKSNWLKSNAVEVTIDNNRYITLQQYASDPDNPSKVTFNLDVSAAQLKLQRTDVRIIVSEGTATLKLTVPGSPSYVEAQPFNRYADSVHMRTMKTGDKSLMDQGKATISSVLVYGYAPKNVLVDTCYE